MAKKSSVVKLTENLVRENNLSSSDWAEIVSAVERKSKNTDPDTIPEYEENTGCG